MNTVILSQNGSIVHNMRTVENDPLMFLSFKIELEQGYTLSSYFHMLNKYALLLKLNAFFPTYLEQYLESPERKSISENFDYLEFSKTVEMIGFPGKPRLELYNTFYGVYGNKICDIKSVPIENLLYIPIKLGRLKHIVFGDEVDVFEFDTVFSLFEFIDGVAWELSFHGTSVQCEIRR